MELISIVMPVYNGQDYIRQTIDSILAQTYCNWELICVNDSSTDGSLAILEQYAVNDSRIQVFTNPNGGSASKATKVGIAKITDATKYFFYLSQDDLMSATLLEKCVQRAIETGAQAIMPDMEWYYENENFEKPSNKQDYIGYRGDSKAIITGRQAFEGSIKYWVPGFFMVEMAVVKKVGFYDFSYNSTDATGKLWLLNCSKVAFCDDRFFYRQDNPGAITQKISPLLFDALITNNWLYGYINTNFDGNKELLDYVKHLQLDDLIMRRRWLFDKTIIGCEKYQIAKEKTKKAYKEFQAQGGYRSSGGVKDIIKAFLINNCYGTFSLYTRRLNGK